MSYTTWTKTSKAYSDYLVASQRCVAAFSETKAETVETAETIIPEPVLGTWVHPKTGQTRYYVNNVATLIGLSYTRYNTGNISSAALAGKYISNSEANRVLGNVSYCKVWMDEDNQLHMKAPHSFSNCRSIAAADVLTVVRGSLVAHGYMTNTQ